MKIVLNPFLKCSVSKMQILQQVVQHTYWSWWGTEQGVRGSGDWNLGWGWNNPTQNLVNAYEPGDPRKAATILFSGQSDDPANGGYGRTLPPLTNSLYWNKKTYVSQAGTTCRW